MDNDTKRFVDNVDAWIKQIRGEFSEFTDISSTVEDNTGNIQHNYELVYELKEEINDLKRELNALKLIQLATIKSRVMSKT